jgi:HAMP domain-containing protein
MIARFQSLQVRFLASLVLSVAAALVTVAIMSRWSTTLQFETYVQQNRDEMQQVARKLAADMGQRVVAANAAGRVFIDSSNELLGTTVEPSPDQINPPGLLRNDRVMVFTVAAVPNGKVAPIASGDTMDSADMTLPGVGIPAPGPWALKLGVASPSGAIVDPEDLFLSSFNRSLLVGVVVGGAVALVLALALSRGIVRSVEALTLAARRMADGQLDQRVVVGSNDEIGELGRAFNAMAEGLTHTEQLRRSMVTDVAHELRTPLTNLRGYLEALRDGVAEPGRDVIASLYDEAVLLTQLVDDLQDLALSDAGQLTLQRVEIDAAELVASAVRAAQPEALRRLCSGGCSPHRPGVAQSAVECTGVHTSRRECHSFVGGACRRIGGARRRHRVGHSAGAPAQCVRALLPRRRLAGASHRRRRDRAGHRQAVG